MARTEIEVPRDLSDKSLIRFFQGWKWIQAPLGPVTLDFRRVNFIAPWAVSLFAAYALWLITAKKKKPRILIDPRSVAGYYIVRSGLPDLLRQPIEIDEDANVDRTAKITQITKSEEIPDFVSHVMELLRIEDEDVAGAVKRVVT